MIWQIVRYSNCQYMSSQGQLIASNVNILTDRDSSLLLCQYMAYKGLFPTSTVYGLYPG